MTKESVEHVGGLACRVVSPSGGPARGAVVLVHGICMSGKIWSRWAERLAGRGLEVWSVDLRGHGDSEGRAEVGTAKMDDYADDLEAVLDAAGAQAVVGHDMGGLVAQMVAARRELRGLALVGTVAPKGLTGRSNVLLLWRELRPRYVRALLRGKAWQPTEEDLVSIACNKLSEEDRALVLSWVTPESGVAAREMSITGVPVDETKLRCPILVAATTLDILTPPARQRQVASRYRADYVEFAQHAHFPMLEPGWERTVAVVGRWLEEAARLGDNARGSVARLAAVRRTSTPTSTPVPATAVAAASSAQVVNAPPPERTSVPPAAGE
jgi:pimeloyl-ACP methyl ester carboxylesterase